MLPPYADEFSGTHGEKETANQSLKKRKTKGGSLGQSSRHGGYGVTEGNLSAQPPGKLDVVVSSPLFEKSMSSGKLSGIPSASGESASYGESNGQLGQEQNETFWSSALVIVRQCYQVLKPGGRAVFVTKDFVRHKKRVPFSADWLKLCLTCGFELVCHHHALLTKLSGQLGLDGVTRKKKERKSFFRRLAERKGSPVIDHEDVLCLRKLE